MTLGTHIARRTAVLPKAVRERIMEGMALLHIPGVAVGLRHDGVEAVAGFGVTSVAHPQPVDEDTLFQVGSLTKTVTATALLRLVERGLLGLQTPLRAYLPDLRLADEATASGVTAEHLLTHTGGWIGDYFADTGRGDDALARIVAQMATLPQLTPLGTTWSYNNAGFYLAGRVIEVLTAQPYEEAVRDLVLDPLGLRHSVFFAEDALLHAVAVGHNVEGGRATVASPWAVPRSAHAAAGLISSARDQLRYACFHLGTGRAQDGTPLLSRASMALMQTPTVAAWPGERVGLSWFVRVLDGVPILRHSGSTNGQFAVCTCVPARDFALTILTNATSGAQLRRELTVWALHHYLGLAEEEPTPRACPTEHLAAYAGRYTAPLAVVTLVVRDGGLVLEEAPTDAFPADTPPPGPPPAPVAFCAPDTVIMTEGIRRGTRAEFLRHPDGSIAWLRLEGRIHRRCA